MASVTGPQTFTLTAPYSGSKTPGVFYDYLVLRDFTANHGLAEMSPGDVDIRDIFTYNMRKIDEIMFIPSEFPAGVKMLFGNDVTPLGWTRVVDFNDRMVRIVSGSLANPGTSWQVTGLSIPDHRHEIGLFADGGGTVWAGAPFGLGGQSFLGDALDVKGHNAVQTSLSDYAGADGVTSTGEWRPPSFDVILGCKD